MLIKRLTLLAVLISLVVLWGCGSSMDSGGDQSGGGTTLADALTVGINNCLNCHNPATTLTQQWMAARHGNRLLAGGGGRLANDALESLSDDPRPSSCGYCHPESDSNTIDYDYVAQFEDNTVTNWGDPTAMGGTFIGCESCHGGGQFHNGIASGIPFASPSALQCGQCHYLNDTWVNPEWDADGVYPQHTMSSSGNNVRRNISDTHRDDPTTNYGSAELDPTDPDYKPNIIEGYVVKDEGTGSCSSCHIAHDFDLTINYQWGNSPHGGNIKAVKDAVLAAGVAAAVDDATRLQLLADVTAAGVDETTGDAWLHYDWDDSAGNGPGGRNRSSCQRCHTSTGLVNFLNDTANYDPVNNDFSHLEGWTANGNWSGQNEMLYCWGCHTDVQTGELRDDPNGITLDFVYLDFNEDPLGVPEFVVVPDKGNSNVCAACHSGRGNNTSIRDNYAEAVAEPDPADRNLSSRFAGHHAPTAGSLYAAVTHTGFEYENPPGTPLDYTTPSLLHDQILENTSGPCAGCHMGGDADHNFKAVDRTGATVITNQALCDDCHSAVNGAFLDALKTDFEAARDILLDLVSNTITNYLGIDISASANRYTDILSLNDYGAFQNSVYMQEEPCIRVHNSLYGKRLMFDSIDWLEDGDLNSTIANYGAAGAWLGGTTRP